MARGIVNGVDKDRVEAALDMMVHHSLARYALTPPLSDFLVSAPKAGSEAPGQTSILNPIILTT